MQSLSGYNFTKIKHIGVSIYYIKSADNAQNVHRQREHKHAVADATEQWPTG